MRSRLRRSLIPAYVLLCILLGGSAQGIWRNMALQLLAIAVIAWAALWRRGESLTRASKLLVLLVAGSILVVVLQLTPLPPDVWTTLPGRDAVVAGYHSLGYRLPWLPLSLTPYETLGTALTLLPPIAVLLGIVRLGAYEESWIAGSIIAGALLSVVLGAVQTVRGPTGEAWWYLYEFTNNGVVGFFANRNHLATLLLVAIPFAAAAFAAGTPQVKSHGRGSGMFALGAGGFLLVVVGLALNRSLAGVALALPVIAASALILPAGWRVRRLAIAAAALTLIGGLVALVASPLHGDLASAELGSSAGPRQAIWKTTGAAVTEHFPTGTGIGSFEQVYPLYEDPGEAAPTYINHAHNDYIETVLEAGLPAILLLMGFFAWWLTQAVRIWRSPLSSHFARAATIASAAILAHSAVDYPLRTAAIAALFAASLGMMAQPGRGKQSNEASDLGPPKHVIIG